MSAGQRTGATATAGGDAEAEVTPRRSDRTRASILNAARRRFARDGYERATIRAIAADARIDPSMVMRYYGSKKALFAAAAKIDLRLPDLTRAPRSRLGERMIAHFLNRWEGALAEPLPDGTHPGPGSQVDEALLVLLRAAVTNEDAAERMRAMLLEQVAPAVATVAPDRPDERAAMVTSQVLGIALCRYVLRMPAITRLDQATLIARFGPTIQRYLTGALPR